MDKKDNSQNSLKVALIQLAYRRGVDNALDAAETKISEAAEFGAELVVLPEMFCCPYTVKHFREYAQGADGEICARMATAAKKHGVILAAGTIPELGKDDGVYNTAFVFDPDGNEICRHRKVHLFDVDIEGGISFKESDTLSAGDKISVFDTKFGKMGLAVCYDIRFAEMFRIMQLEGCRVVIVPACFSISTGPFSWELLFRSRAVDGQCFTLGCSQARIEGAPYTPYSHSIICDPWGNVLADAGTEEGIIYADLDLTLPEKVGEQLPVFKQFRNDVYSLPRRTDR